MAILSQSTKPPAEAPKVRMASAAEDLSFTSSFSSPSYTPPTKAGPPSLQPRSKQELAQLKKPVPVAPAEIEIQPEEEEGFFASIFSTTSVLVILALGIFGLVGFSQAPLTSRGAEGGHRRG